MSTFTPQFRRTTDLIGKLHLVPRVEQIIADCDFPAEFKVTFRRYTAERAPDDWFHPSGHPEMPERKLYYYLTEPHLWRPEPFPYRARMSVMMGTAMHDLIGVAMVRLGLLSAPTGTCVACGLPHGRGKGKCSEWGVRDDRLRRRGHLDGLIPHLPGWGRGVFDLKTCDPMVLRGIRDHDVAAFRAKWPKYYGQQQEYMAMSGEQQSLVLFLGMSGGWELKEFTIPRDDAYIAALENKYAAVRNYQAARTVPPVACCSGGATARKCPATGCPIKLGLAA